MGQHRQPEWIETPLFNLIPEVFYYYEKIRVKYFYIDALKRKFGKLKYFIPTHFFNSDYFKTLYIY